MAEDTHDGVGKISGKNIGKGLALVGLCVIGCKLPLVLAFLGLGGLGVTASVLGLPSSIGTLGVAVAIVGFVAAALYFLYKAYQRAHS